MSSPSCLFRTSVEPPLMRRAAMLLVPCSMPLCSQLLSGLGRGAKAAADRKKRIPWLARVEDVSSAAQDSTVRLPG